MKSPSFVGTASSGLRLLTAAASPSLARSGPSLIPPRPRFSRNHIPHSSPSRTFASTSTALAQHHFDTHQFVRRLEHEGLSRKQAEGLVFAIENVIDESVQTMSSGFVTKAAQERQHYTQQVDFAQLKSEVQLVEKNDISLLKAENDRLASDLEKLKSRLREEITRTQAGVRLDMNLEKGRLRDENTVQELKLREVEGRIESEMAGLRTSIENAKSTTLQYLGTVLLGCGALVFAWARFRF